VAKIWKLLLAKKEQETAPKLLDKLKMADAQYNDLALNGRGY